MSADLNNEASHQAGGEPVAVYNAPDNAPQNITPTQAARMLASLRKRHDDTPPPEAAPEEAAAPAVTEESTPQGEDASPPIEAATGETEGQAEPEAEELPAIEPPKSWKADEKERFKSLPRETQEYLAERETERDRALNRSQSEAAEKLKGLTLKEQAVEQARQQYESALPQLLQNLHAQQSGEFSDVKTIADVERLAREDWPRYLQWDVAQKKIAAVQQEMLLSQQRQQQEKAEKWQTFAKTEDSLFVEKVPDLADATKAEKLQKAAISTLKDLGFNETELGNAWNGAGEISLRDHRMQLLIRDATLWREAQSKAKTATAKPVPPVQRPGVAKPRTADADAQIQALTKQLEQSSGMNATRLAARLLGAKRAAAAR